MAMLGTCVSLCEVLQRVSGQRQVDNENNWDNSYCRTEVHTQGVNTGLLRDHAVKCWIALLVVVNLNGGENCS